MAAVLAASQQFDDRDLKCDEWDMEAHTALRALGSVTANRWIVANRYAAVTNTMR